MCGFVTLIQARPQLALFFGRPILVRKWLDKIQNDLTAATGPPPRDPYRHALTIQPPQKARPFSFLNYQNGMFAKK